ncbi:hypothetical protein SAMN05216349_10362 [Oribacterium sp. KHPX15]|uniref:hypothetical protein n=1 Tax=unclassified Oribacterium TaxID=2629782 RepID=UPI0004E0C954|nr:MULTISPECIES: hypothetical protein [unclassified Oribacterium]SDZ96869.1 hypothetical protein SAMN05216349_10362 [Oribacterium sp. KHPX15]
MGDMMKKIIIIGVMLLMGIGSIIGILSTKKAHMPVEPVEIVENNVNHEEHSTEELKETGIEGEFAFLQEIASCDETQAIKIAAIFEDVTGHKLDNAEEVSVNKQYLLLKVKTADKNYYLTIGKSKLLQKISEDSETGKVLYQIIF